MCVQERFIQSATKSNESDELKDLVRCCALCNHAQFLNRFVVER